MNRNGSEVPGGQLEPFNPGPGHWRLTGPMLSFGHTQHTSAGAGLLLGTPAQISGQSGDAGPEGLAVDPTPLSNTFTPSILTTCSQSPTRPHAIYPLMLLETQWALSKCQMNRWLPICYPFINNREKTKCYIPSLLNYFI